MRPSISVGHLSDTHLGREMYNAISPSGHNQRGQDFVRAAMHVVNGIVDDDPPLVVHSGDALERPHVANVYLVVLRKMLSTLAGLRPDGTRRQVVIISGNHDQPGNRRDVCALEVFRDIPGVHVVSTRYDIIQFTGAPGSPSENCDPDLRNVAVHCLPHDVLKTVDFADVQPIDGLTNILTSHGVAGGSDLFLRSLGREFPIPADTLGRDWDYVALGHWHKQGPIALTSGLTKIEGEVGKIWYAGSTENSGFGDLKDNGTQRGWLKVLVRPGAMPQVERRFVPIRTMFRLPHLDATGMTPEQITDELKQRLRTSTTPLSGAVVGQLVSGTTRDVWSLVDRTAVRVLAMKEAMHYEPKLEAEVRTARAEQDVTESGLGDVGELVTAKAEQLLTKPEVDPTVTLAGNLLGTALRQGPITEPGDGTAGEDEGQPNPALRRLPRLADDTKLPAA